MKKRLFILLALVFLLCGCSAEVNLTITDSKIDENITIVTFADNTTTKTMIKNGFRKYVPAFVDDVIADTEPDERVTGIRYYNFESQDLANGYKNTYSFEYRFDEFKRSRSVKEAFKSVTIQNDNVDREIMLSTDSGGIMFFNSYPKLENVKINIKTDYRVKENNADSHKDNVYTWVFTPSNNQKNIYLLLDKNHKWTDNVSENEDEDKDKDKDKDTNKTNPEKKEGSRWGGTNNDSSSSSSNQDNSKTLIIIGVVVVVLFILWLLSKVKLVKEK